MSGQGSVGKHSTARPRGIGRWPGGVASAAAGLAAFAFGWAAAATAGQEPPRRPHALAVDGHRFAEYGPEGQLAFLSGFLAGAAAAQAADAAGGPTGHLDSLTAELADPALAQRLHFPLAPTVYLARLQDYYFYRDRRDRPAAAAILEINHRLLTQNF